MRLLLALLLLPALALATPEHHALEASLNARASANGATLRIDTLFPGAPSGTRVYWRADIAAPDGTTLTTLHGELLLSADERAAAQIEWPLADRAPGVYGFALQTTAVEPWMQARIDAPEVATRVQRALAFAPNGVVHQHWPVPLGNPPAVAMPAFPGMTIGVTRAVDPPGGLPYRVYLANLHSQANHSDGGGAIATCTSSQGAQTGQFGPVDGWTYAMVNGLDALLISEHNHYFDGSSSTNASATPATAIALYQSGVQGAIAHNLANPNFLALYGMEWGVISNGGHLNILGGNQLWGWEFNSSNQLLADVFTARSDYAPLYALMRQHGLVGQFNHPATSGQFTIDGTALASHPDGEEVMVLSEILNTSAFSNNTTETETSRSSYEGAYNRLLERGYRVAPTSNQDNHCANWGMSYTNRTGVLIPIGTALSPQSFLDALRARRVYATMDRTSQIVLRGNGRLMGERFVNEGLLDLEVLFASSGGHSVSQVLIREGVPGRNGTVTTLASTPTHSFTPTLGSHFYYAKIVQDDGDILCGARPSGWSRSSRCWRMVSRNSRSSGIPLPDTLARHRWRNPRLPGCCTRTRTKFLTGERVVFRLRRLVDWSSIRLPRKRWHHRESLGAASGMHQSPAGPALCGPRRFQRPMNRITGPCGALPHSRQVTSDTPKIDELNRPLNPHVPQHQ